MTDKCELITFSSFTVAPKNQGKFQVAQILAADPSAFRLVVIDDMPSDERFAMKHAILNAWTLQDIDWASINISDFIDEVILSIKSGKAFNAEKFDFDCLVIDDLQHILGKSACQEEFFRSILKKRLENDQLTVLFCEYPLSELVSLSDEVRNFLKIGVKGFFIT